MNVNKEQIARIRQMERLFVRASATMRQFSTAFNKYAALHEAMAALDKYYGSEEWRNDFADDEAGRLPKELKRGVLSEDGIWNLLSDYKELNLKVMETIGQWCSDNNSCENKE